MFLLDTQTENHEKKNRSQVQFSLQEFTTSISVVPSTLFQSTRLRCGSQEKVFESPSPLWLQFFCKKFPLPWPVVIILIRSWFSFSEKHNVHKRRKRLRQLRESCLPHNEIQSPLMFVCCQFDCTVNAITKMTAYFIWTFFDNSSDLS